MGIPTHSRGPRFLAPERTRGLLAHAGAVGLAFVAHLGREGIRAVTGIEHTILFLYFPAILAAALWLGLGPGLLCAVAGVLLVAWEAPPEGSLLVAAPSDIEYAALFGVCAVLGCLMIEFARRHRSYSREATQRQRSEVELRKAADARIEGNEARLEAILKTAASSILTIDGRGIVESMNPATERMFGYASSEVVGRNVSMLMPSPFSEEHDGYLAAYLRTGARKIIGIGREVIGRRKDGSTFPCHLAVSEVRLEGQTLFTGFIADLSTQKDLEREFLHAQKLEAIGKLSSGIAHDFNNLLMGIMACSRMAGSEVHPDSPVRALFDEIGSAAGRGIALTRRLLAFSRRQAVELRPTSVNDVVRQNETMLRQLLGEDIALRVDLVSGGAHILADDGLIEQILINLLINARDAMPRGGEIAVTTREPVAGSVVLDVCDAGVGIPADVLGRIFEPFFSTKGPERGTGLGLSTVKRIVSQLRGSIEVESEIGRGTTFRLAFPGAEPGVKEIMPRAAPPAVRLAGRGVLLVEDDRLVRSSLRLFLERKGYRVLVAESAAQAREALAQGAIEVLVTDMVLPDGMGSDLARAIQAEIPGVKVVFMSAHPPELLQEQGRLAAGAAYLEKPFEMDALDDLLGRVLAGETVAS